MTDREPAGPSGDLRAEIDRHYQRIVKLCLFYLGDLAEAEDAAQAACEKIWLHRERFAGQSSAFTWMYRIAVNTSINVLRRRRLLRWLSLETGSEAAPLEGLGQPAPTPPEEMERNQERERCLHGLGRALERMSEREKAAFYLFHYERMRQREIADIMRTTPAAVESLVHKAMAKVRAELAGTRIAARQRK